jgi:hypothetical protein
MNDVLLLRILKMRARCLPVLVRIERPLLAVLCRL